MAQYIACFFLLLTGFLSKSQVKEQNAFVKNGNVNIHYTVYGEGEPVLVANGGPGFSSVHLQDFARQLATKKFQVILFDQRGTGRSVLPVVDSSTLSIDLLMDDMLAIVKATGHGSVHVMGHSFGGILAMQFAQQHPQQVKKLVLCSSAGINLNFLDYFGDNIAQRLPFTPVDTALKPPVTFAERENFFYRMVTNNAPAYLYNKSNVGLFVSMLTIPGSYNPDFNRVIWIDLFARQYDLSKKLRRFKKPALVIQGRQDIMGDETGIRIHEAIPGSQLVFLQQCGHVPWLDQPDVFFKELVTFLVSP